MVRNRLYGQPDRAIQSSREVMLAAAQIVKHRKARQAPTIRPRRFWLPDTGRGPFDPTIAREPTPETIGPQSGPQRQFLATPADIAIYGGAAGAGKSFALLLDAVRHLHNSRFSAVFFRRTSPQIKAEGGLWDTSEKIYRHAGGYPVEGKLEWRFPSGATVRFAHMQLEKNKFDWDSSQVPLIGFDQLESFTEKQFWYMLSRNRSTCGVRPYIRGTCNPDPDCFLRSLLSWWIDEKTGFPIPERSGVLRWFVRRKDVIHWADTPEDLVERFGKKAKPLSLTFIAGTIEDNPILMAEDPDYLPKLEALREVERQRLHLGNWNARESAGTYFRREWIPIVDVAPACIRVMRYWDRALGTDEDGPASAGVKAGLTERGQLVILHSKQLWLGPGDREDAIDNLASQDGHDCSVGIEQDPAQAGKYEATQHVRRLEQKGYHVVVNTVHEKKAVRILPVSGMAKNGNLILVRGEWNDAYFRELENFDGSDTCRSDQVDATSGVHLCLTSYREAGVW